MQQQGKKLSKNNHGRSSTPDQFIYGKVPPQAIDLEKVVLGAIMLERDAFDNVSEILKPECFYVESHQRIFKSMKTLAGKNMPIDLLTVVQELQSSGELELAGGPFGLTQLTSDVTSAANIVSHAKFIFQKFHLRELIKLSSEINSLAYEDGTDNFELQDYAEKLITELGTNNISGGMISIDKVLMDAVGKIEEWRKNDDSITGVPSGFAELDKATRGWQPGDLIILAARPSVGKTALALNLIKNAASNFKKPVTVGVWSLEMKAVYLALRMLAAESKTFLYRLQTGKLSDDDMQNLMSQAVKELSKLHIFFEENSAITLSSLSRKARRLKKKEGLGLIVIDYLQLMSGEEGKGNREQEIAKISRGLKNLAQELDIPIIALSQLSREMGSKNVTWEYGPPISSIRESGAIEQDADVIMMLWGPSDEDIARDPTLSRKRKVRIAKQRNGVLITEELDFKNEIQMFQKIENISTVQTMKFNYVTEPAEPDDEMPF